MTECPVCGEGLGRYHETELTCRRCGSLFCPSHRTPETHDCQAASPGRFQYEDGPSDQRVRVGAGQRPTAARDRRGRGALAHSASVLGVVMLGLYLLNVPLSYAGVVDSAVYPPPWFFVGTGGLLLGYTVFAGVSGQWYRAWSTVRLALLFGSLVLVALPGAAFAFAPGFRSAPVPASPDYFLATGSPLLASAGYTVGRWAFGW